MTQSARRQRLTELLADAPDDPELRYALAMEDLSSGDLDSAVRGFLELTNHSPPHVPSFLMAAQTLLKLNRSQEAVDILKSGVAAAMRQGNLHAQSEMQGLLDSLL